MRYASIDIGTNTILLLIVEVKPDFREIIDISESPRLGENLKECGILSKDAIERTISVLKKYKEIVEKERVDELIVFGTAALREAKNSELFQSLIKKKVGFDVEILSEKEEAYYSYLSCVMDKKLQYGSEVIIDIGGGSTEVVYVDDMEPSFIVSLPFGAVKLKETFIFSDPPDSIEIKSLKEFVRKEIESRLKSKITDIVACGGTVTNLGAMLSKRSYFDKELINGMKVYRTDVERLLKNIERMSKSQIKKEYPQLQEKREDIILCGIALLYELMDFFQSQYLKISAKGVRYGIIFGRVKEAQEALKDHP